MHCSIEFWSISGFKKEEPPSFGVIDGFDPKTKEEFDKFSQMLCEKITKFDVSLH